MAVRNNIHKWKVSTYNCKYFYDVEPKLDFINDFINKYDMFMLYSNTL